MNYKIKLSVVTFILFSLIACSTKQPEPEPVIQSPQTPLNVPTNIPRISIPQLRTNSDKNTPEKRTWVLEDPDNRLEQTCRELIPDMARLDTILGNQKLPENYSLNVIEETTYKDNSAHPFVFAAWDIRFAVISPENTRLGDLLCVMETSEGSAVPFKVIYREGY